MPQCEKHGHMNCRECFPQPSYPFDRRCLAQHPKTGRQCQQTAGHSDDHRRNDSEHGVVSWPNLKI